MASGGEKRPVSRGNMNFLLREAKVWRDLGLISAEQADGICGLYSARRGRLQNALLGLGGTLVGLGVLSFVAANWLDMSRLLRAFLILAGYTVALVASWLCWERFPRTSRAFLLIGSFIYGGGIFLIGQMFHQGGEWRSALGWWIAGLIPTVGLFRDRWQAVLLQGLTALYLLFNPLFHPGRVWNVVTWGSTPLWDCLEPFLRNPDELLIVAALGALTLTHRQRIRPKRSQARIAQDKLRDYAVKGTHPGQRPMPGVYAATNSAAAPALDADGAAVEESIPRVLRARDLGYELAEISPETAAAARAGQIRSRTEARIAQSGMASMPGAAAPAVVQPMAAPALPEAPAADPSLTEAKEEDK